MPAYDYRCTTCGRELELVHRMSEVITNRAHTRPESDEPCDGALERLISLAGLNDSVGTKPPSDTQLARAGFTKYVRGAKGYEKAAGPPGSPDYIRRE
ncbi:hypothetical protein L6R52_24050 [Myxococcota bacterium]|nr:hypothetical protein [Myxococcota bacterium]